MLEQPMYSGDNPEWVSAVWAGELDLSDLTPAPPDSKPELADGSDHHRTRSLVHENQTLRGFVTMGIEGGQIRGDEFRRAIDRPPVAVPESEPSRSPISMVICTRNRERLPRDAVNSALVSDYLGPEVVAVGNTGSMSETRDLALRYPDLRVRYTHEPLAGNSHGRNRGLRVVAHEHVASIDDDVMMDRHWLMGIAHGLARDPHVGLVCGLVSSGEIRTRTQAWFDQRVIWTDARESRMYSLSSPPPELPLSPFQAGAYGTSASIALTRTASESVDGFDVTLGSGQSIKGGEDTDLYPHMLAAGHSISVEPSATIWYRHHSDPPALKAQVREYGTGTGV